MYGFLSVPSQYHSVSPKFMSSSPFSNFKMVADFIIIMIHEKVKSVSPSQEGLSYQRIRGLQMCTAAKSKIHQVKKNTHFQTPAAKNNRIIVNH